MGKWKRPPTVKPSPADNKSLAVLVPTVPKKRKATAQELAARAGTGTIADKTLARAASTLTLEQWKNLALMDFVTDPQSRPFTYHYQRRDREYHKLVAYEAFSVWSREGNWHDRRVRYWEEVVARVQSEFVERVALQRIKEIDRMTIAVDAISEYAMPLLDEDGKVVRHKDGVFQGLPKFALPMPDFDKVVTMLTKLQEKLLLLRGEATSRSETTTTGVDKDGKPIGGSLDSMKGKVNFSVDEIRAMSKLMLVSRQPELLDDAIDIEAELGEEEEVRGKE